MLVVNSFDKVPKVKKPIAVTIGTFDGLHLGHRAIFKRLRAKAGAGTTAVITFSNHPSEVLTPDNPAKLIYAPKQKLAIMEALDIDLCVMLTFTKETASNTYDQFIKRLRKVLPFEDLVLGHDAVLGKGRTGTPDKMYELAALEGFEVEYLPAVKLNGEPVSSKRIRTLMKKGDDDQASRLLGK